jgi:thiol-disulfide isomerase/thioredoxin
MMKMLVLMVVSVMLLFGCAGAPAKNDSMQKPVDSMEKPGTSMNKTNDSMEKPGDAMNKSNGSMEKPGDSMAKPVGYVPFTKSAYDQARAEHKVIFLEFYASWCPICAMQAPALEEAFSELKDPDVAAFRVNYKDSDTDADEQALARDFGITYQHSHVILGTDGSVKKKSTGEAWSKETILSEVGKVSNG